MTEAWLPVLVWCGVAALILGFCAWDVVTERAGPFDMVLHCPACGMRHIDAPGMSSEYDDHAWANPPHRSHLCAGCGHIWRPADVPTNGVAAINTRGKNDSRLV